MKPYEKLLAHWRSDGIDVASFGATEAEVAALEAKYGVQLPDDFREYLLNASPRAGMDVFYAHENHTDWWEVGQVKSAPEEGEEINDPVILQSADRYLYFADYISWCWAWAINCSDDEHRGRVIMVGSPAVFVADSFTAFVDLFVENVDNVC